MVDSIYIDNHATTPVDPRVLEVMLPYFKENFGNAASRQHAYGWVAEEAVAIARKQVADLIGAKKSEIIFTSGATESNNMALLGVARRYQDRGNHIVTVVTEHRAVLDPLQILEKDNFKITRLSVDKDGSIDLEKLRKAITDKTILISIMAANNEIGTIHPVAEIGKIAKEAGVLFHTDAAQAVGKIPIDVEAMRIDLLSFSAHKLYGPKGIGALYIRSREPHVRLAPLVHGGGHEHGLRSGTLAVPLIVGLGQACELAKHDMEADAQRLTKLRDDFFAELQNNISGITLNGHPTDRLPNNLNVSFEGIEAQALMMTMTQVAVSSGSACTTASPNPSHVLQAIGLTKKQAMSALRFGLGRFTTEEEINAASVAVADGVQKLRKL